MTAVSGATPTRTLIVWCPDWPIAAWCREMGAGALSSEGSTIALVERGEVFACSLPARAAGVRRGLRVREAQSRCSELIVEAYDPAVDARAFEPIILALEEVVPGIQVLRAGMCAIRAQGPSRYYGGEQSAGELLIDTLARFGIHDARIGIADGIFAAEQAARVPGTEMVRVVPAGRSAEFLAGLPVELLGRAELNPLLHQLGVHTLAQFAALDPVSVRDRFGEDGAFCHRLAAGLDGRDVTARVPPPQLDCRVEFETPLDRVDQVAFGFRQTAERFVATIAEARLVATAIRVEVHTDDGRRTGRTWLHPRWFTASDVLDRVRWQLQGGHGIDAGLAAPVVSVSVSPESVDRALNHEDGLWGGGPDESIHHGFSRVQSMLGHEGVVTAVLTGGRLLSSRSALVPWGDLPPGGEKELARRRQLPWPGSVPGPLPSTVFEAPVPVLVRDAGGRLVDVDGRGILTGEPVVFAAGIGERSGGSGEHPVRSWSGPWPLSERWWEDGARSINRFQLVDALGRAWLLILAEHEWWAEALYD